MFRWIRRNKSTVSIFLFLTILLIFPLVVKGEYLDNTNSACSDVLLVFDRGSSDNPLAMFLGSPFSDSFADKERITGAFFQAMKSNLDRDYPHVTYKAVSVHNFPNLYNSNGYRAVGIFGPTTVNNIFEAELSWWPFGEYRQSVSDGVDETVGYIKDQISLCPEQRIVMGGYSQGANVAGDALFGFTEQERSHISAITLFGDPKYIGSDTTNATPVDYLSSLFNKPKAKPWKRGTATLADRGSLDARVPYVPTDMENKTLSWCFNDDFVCTGGSGLLQIFSGSPLDGYRYDKNDLGAGHSRYATFGAPQAASEITQRLAPQLEQVEVAKGGVNPEMELAQPTPNVPNATPQDVMFMVDVSYGVDDVLGQLRQNTAPVLSGLSSFFGDVMYGVGEYNETGSLPNSRVPHTAIRHALTTNLDSLISAMNRKLAYGTLSGGGLDAPDPHMIGVERGVMATEWRADAIKHLVIITDRPSLESYTYNMCNSDIRIGFGIEEPNQCMGNPLLETAPANAHPERCINAYQVLASTTCSLFMTSPYYIYNVTRTIDDAIQIAQSKGISVTFVVPHAYQSSVNKTTADAQLKRFANSTGGLFLTYDAYTRASYTDTVWRVLNQKPKLLSMSMLGDFDSLGSAESLQKKSVASTKTFAPTMIDVSGPNNFQEYKWDFNGDGTWDESTSSPTNEYIYTEPSSSSFVTVGGFDNGTEQSRVSMPLVVTPGSPQEQKTPPPAPEDIRATRKLNGEIVISWTIPENASGVVVIVADPEAHLPIKSIPASSGQLILPSESGVDGGVEVWVENIDGSSEKIVVEIINEVPVPDETPPNQTVDPDPIVVDTPNEDPDVIVDPSPPVDTRPPSDKELNSSSSWPDPVVIAEYIKSEQPQSTQQDSAAPTVSDAPVTIYESSAPTAETGYTDVKSAQIVSPKPADEKKDGVGSVIEDDSISPTLWVLIILVILSSIGIVYRYKKKG